MVPTVLKCHFVRLQPTTIQYRDYKYSDPEAFTNDIKDANLDEIKSLSDGPSSVYRGFCAHFKSILDLHAPLNSKTLRGNKAPFTSKDLSKAIMIRSRLKNKFNRQKLKQTGKPIHFKEIGVFSSVKRPLKITFQRV